MLLAPYAKVNKSSVFTSTEGLFACDFVSLLLEASGFSCKFMAASWQDIVFKVSFISLNEEFSSKIIELKSKKNFF